MTDTAATFDIEALPVQIDYIGEMPSPWSEDKPRNVDAWRVTIGKQWGNKAGQWVTTYYTGLGLRKAPRGQKCPYPPRSAMAERWAADTLKPQRPTVADVLYSLFSDASAADENFSDWCSNYGYSDDSIKALNIYKACTDIAQNLRRQFDPATRAQIQAIIQEM